MEVNKLKVIIDDYHKQLTTLNDFLSDNHRLFKNAISHALTSDCSKENEKIRLAAFEVINIFEEFKENPNKDTVSKKKLVHLTPDFVKRLTKVNKATSTTSMFNQMVLIQIATIQEALLKDVMLHIYEVSPMSMMSKNEVKVERILSCSDMNEFKREYAKELVQGVKGGSDGMLKAYRKFGIDLSEHFSWSNMVELIARRNIFVHNKGIIDVDYLQVVNPIRGDIQSSADVSIFKRVNIGDTDKLGLGEKIELDLTYMEDNLAGLESFSQLLFSKVQDKFYKN